MKSIWTSSLTDLIRFRCQTASTTR